MRFAFRPASLASHLVAFAAGAMTIFIAAPMWREVVIELNQERYGALVEKCDSSMRDHYQAKMRASNEPSRETGLALSAAEIGLIICQDYDIYQKYLMQWGLRESELAQMRLRAVEERAEDLDQVVKNHEIHY